MDVSTWQPAPSLVSDSERKLIASRLQEILDFSKELDIS